MPASPGRCAFRYRIFRPTRTTLRPTRTSRTCQRGSIPGSLGNYLWGAGRSEDSSGVTRRRGRLLAPSRSGPGSNGASKSFRARLREAGRQRQPRGAASLCNRPKLKSARSTPADHVMAGLDFSELRRLGTRGALAPATRSRGRQGSIRVCRRFRPVRLDGNSRRGKTRTHRRKGSRAER